jgi:peptidyl-tRNA hydrolase, PTH1 family
MQEQMEPLTDLAGDSLSSNPASRVYCIVGLGNPGLRYEDTPHNLGFLVVDELGRRHGIRVVKNEGIAMTGVGRIRDRSVVLVKPQTFMNNSGGGVWATLKARNLGSKDLILVHDELDIQWTGLKIRKKGSAAGHNGVRSVIASVGTAFFCRVRVGVKPDRELDDPAIYLLTPWERAIKNELAEIVGYAADAVEAVVAEGALQAMAKFNRRARGIQEEET